jgi:hypothetical protein
MKKVLLQNQWDFPGIMGMTPFSSCPKLLLVSLLLWLLCMVEIVSVWPLVLTGNFAFFVKAGQTLSLHMFPFLTWTPFELSFIVFTTASENDVSRIFVSYFKKIGSVMFAKV